MTTITTTCTEWERPEVVLTTKRRQSKDFPDINTLRSAIPEHCFQPSILNSMGYLGRDVACIIGLAWAAIIYIPTIENLILRDIAWASYGFLQGLICTGLWILAHECGHGAFSLYRRLNDVVGFCCHSTLLVPYYSWKFSHHRHHMYTGHMERDMVFVPKTKLDYLKGAFYQIEYLEDTPIYQMTKLLLHQVFAWPMYLLFNISAGDDSRQKESKGILGRTHFAPNSTVFRRSEAFYVALSDIGLCVILFGLYKLASIIGTSTTLLIYAQPYLWVHHWLIAITYLHHNHAEVPHYEAGSWTFVKGALTTVDREFGFIGRQLFHGIIEYHVVHHLFPRIPFYHAEEATNAIKPILGDLYRRDQRSFVGQLWANFTQLQYVDVKDEPGVLYWNMAKR